MNRDLYPAGNSRSRGTVTAARLLAATAIVLRARGWASYRICFNSDYNSAKNVKRLNLIKQHSQYICKSFCELNITLNCMLLWNSIEQWPQLFSCNIWKGYIRVLSSLTVFTLSILGILLFSHYFFLKGARSLFYQHKKEKFNLKFSPGGHY